MTPFEEMRMKDLVEYMARSLAEHPDQVEITAAENEQGSVLELRVAREDLGKVIGRQGRTARAMRVILGAASTRTGQRVALEILE